MYLFPDRSVDALIDVIAGEERICPYVDIPFQHASRPVLRRMNRPGETYGKLPSDQQLVGDPVPEVVPSVRR